MSVLASTLAALAASSHPSAWWREGVVYQIYPRSFLDGCSPACTGTGSLRGIESRLPYLQQLGVTIIWLSPVYDSPMADFGYDIANYTAVWPQFGTMDDMRSLLASATSLGLRILMDFIPNHSSSRHPWFLESRSSRTSAKRDWYVWRKGVNGGPPNNWRTIFCKDVACSAWQLDGATGEYYYHQFLKEQPDLNWRNPQVVAAMHDAMRFWLRLGVSGFRVDAFPYLLEDPLLRDQPLDPTWDLDPIAAGYEKVLPTRTENQPGLHAILRGMQAVLGEFGPDRMMIGEVYEDAFVSRADVLSFYGTPSAPEFNMPFNMDLVTFFGGSFTEKGGIGSQEALRNGTALARVVDAYEASLPPGAQPNYVLGNHDNRRVRTRVGGSERLARSLMLLLLTLRGTPTLYNGDEIGMLDGYVPPGRRQDPPCVVDYEGGRCRDPERTPLQWADPAAAGANAGFTAEGVVPWLPVSADAANTNVAQQLSDDGSMLAMTTRLLRLRAAARALHAGSYASIACEADAVFCYERRDGDGGDAYVVAINLGTDEVTVDATGGDAARRLGTVAIDSWRSASVTEGSVVRLARLRLQQEQGLVVRLTPPPTQPTAAALYLEREPRRDGPPQPSAAAGSFAGVGLLLIAMAALGSAFASRAAAARRSRAAEDLL